MKLILCIYVYDISLLYIADCGKSYNIPNGYANFPGRKTTYQQIIPILCNEGYDIVGNDFITCEADGSWSEGSSCQIKGTINDGRLSQEKRIRTGIEHFLINLL